MMMMEVDQLVMTALTSDMLAAEDTESHPDDLIFNITSPLSYEEGYILSTDDRNLPITTFYQQDLKDLKIAYKPPPLDSDKERIFQIEIEVLDTDGGISDPFAFMIVVKPTNTLAPVVTKNTGQLLYEGQSRPLFTQNNLEISDEDNLDSVRITVVDGLRHGKLTVLGTSKKHFTPAELQTAIVVYQHDGSDTYSDNILFRMTDGKNEVEFLFPITVVPTDDEPPIINANTGLVLFKNQTLPVSPLMLCAADIDSEYSLIKFTIEPPLSTIGEVLLRQSEAPEDPSSWKFNIEDGVYEKAVTEWLQKDITEGKLFYRHTGPHITEMVSDQFIFKAQDDADPPNQSEENRFFITVLPIDDIPPVLFPGTTLQMTVHEYQLTRFRKNVLRYTDLDSEDRDLKYTITQPPTDTDENHPVEFGSIVLTEHPNIVVREFTQAQVDHQMVSYSPPDTELGITAHVAQFQFTVEDTAGNRVEGIFTIFLQPVNNKPPQITNTGFTIFERGMHIITNAELDITDFDTDIKRISLTMSQTPQHGRIQLSFGDLVKGNAFTLSDISDGRISYVQNGDETTCDFFKLDVSDGVHVIPITVRIAVKPIDDEMPTLIFSPNTIGSHLDVIENGATEITTSVIQGKDDDPDDLRLTFIVEVAPTFGEILVNGMLSNRFTQADIISGLVVYAHTSGEIGLSSKQDYFNLTLTDMSDEWAVGGSGVCVHVTILPVDSQAPVVTVLPTFTVFEGGKNTIGGDQIMVEDADTLTEDILCTIVGQPSSGYVENISPAPGSETSRSGPAINAFAVRDVNNGHILYVQSIHKEVEPVEDRFTFRCSDGVNLSERQFFPIVIIPTNDEKPEIFIREFVVMEGMNAIIDTPILNGADADIPAEELTFIISEPPKHGFILNQLTTGSIPVTNFTLEQIKGASSIIYEHDDSETTEDKLRVILTDGKHNVEGIVMITIIAVDDETPRLVINDGLDIEVGESKEINSKILKATDLDSDDDILTFIIRYGPDQGVLQRKTELGSFENITVGMNFTQIEVEQGHILYIHNGQEGIRDLVKFDVTDGTNPLIDRYFYITLSSIDMVFPEVISKRVSLKEGGRVKLTTDLLSTSDLNSPDENLVFTITRAPVRGHLENTDTPGMAIVSFTQLQLVRSKIYYIHTSDDEIKMDSFEFEVTDGYNPVFCTFRVSIVDVDNKKPVLTVHQLLVTEGQSKHITPFELTVEDQDTAEDLLKFTVTQPPAHGKLLFSDSHPVTTFTKQDLNENLISYKHDATESNQDSFSFTVTDGTHTDFYVFPDTVFETHWPQVMQISIVPVGNGVPQIVVNKGVTTLKTLPSGHLGYLITNKVLKAEDRDSSPETLFFYLTTQPEHGYLINLGRGNDAISTFTQADIDDLKICYVLKDKDNATSDIFQFSVEDDGGNGLNGQSLRVDWAWISLQRSSYVVDEQDGLLEVELRRRGYLGETSFVGISTLDDSAETEKDFRGMFQRQVQFEPGQTTATWQVKILSDGKYECSETFHIVLSEPVMGALETPAVSTVEILDPGDESTVFLPRTSLSVEEDAGEVLVPVRRSGDISEELLVFCYTLPGSATGTAPNTVLSFSDYVSRTEEQADLLRFARGEVEKPCRVVIIDDSLYEGEETFDVSLSVALGGRVEPENSTARITILPDLDDAPFFYFGDQQYHVDESDGHVEVHVWRTGTDLSSTGTLTVSSRRTEPPSAEVGVDYIGINKNFDFGPGVTVQSFRVTILDDLGQPLLEGTEMFELVLRTPSNGILGEPRITTVFIHDSISDLPKMQFKQAVLVGEEVEGHLVALVQRSGDATYASTVRCYTRQGSARVGRDFVERPNTDASIITFLPGEVEKPCVLILVDDSLYEAEEEMTLVLGSARTDSPHGASVGRLNETFVTITDRADKPVVRFSETKFRASEPKEPGQVTVVTVPVRRAGDPSVTSVVRVHTKDGSAISGEDYHPVSQVVEFKEGEREHVVEVEVLFDGVREMRESFSIHLSHDENMVAETQATSAIVYIEETNGMADITFPSLPHVVSLLHYDDVRGRDLSAHPPAGYPVVCVTACNPKYPEYAKTGSVCSSERINDTLTRYRWLVGAPSGPDAIAGPMREADFDTFFTSTKMIALDSIYFQAGWRVQCSARAVSVDGAEGLEFSSPVVTVSTKKGMCRPRTAGTVGGEPFSAKLRYTGAEDPDHTNLVKLSVTVPHVDGLLPVVSTRALSNFELTLSRNGSRAADHRCSNLLDTAEPLTRRGFLTKAAGHAVSVSESAPYQYSALLRGKAALRFYRNLNLEACLWEFVTYYDMSELLTDCGGTVGTEGQVLNLVQSYVTLRVPLHVSYVFHSPVGPGSWQHFDLQSELRLTFVYDTAILWRDGVGSPPQAELTGALYPTSMRINEQGRLVVSFRTEARFRGLFVASHPASSVTSMVMSAEHPGLTFNLSLVRNEAAYDPPQQQWTFISDFPVRDYSGTYTIKLMPCVIALSIEYSPPVVCSPREPLTFDMAIRIQQVSDPVAMEFSLNTQMFLLSKRSVWLSDGAVGFVQESGAAFSEGDVIYVRVMVDPVQNLDEAFSCSIEMVYLCAGAEGYVPKYNPAEFQFGCLADSRAILYRFKVIDKAQPETQALDFGGVTFNAVLAVDDPEALALVKQPGSDGFRLASAPLFQGAVGWEWYIHTIYTVRSRDEAKRGFEKRSVEYHSIKAADGVGRARRSTLDVPAAASGIGAENSRGTNIAHISLDRSRRQAGAEGELFADALAARQTGVQATRDRALTLAATSVGLLLAALLVAVLAATGRSRRTEARGPRNASTAARPVLVRSGFDRPESSEV